MPGLGILGGTFDPPHLGHLILAQEALFQLKLERILWVLTPNPPHKTNRRISDTSDRLAMLEAALEDEPRFEISTVDLDRKPPHYAADTMHVLRQQHPNDRLFYLMGGDELVDLPTWHAPKAFLAACDGIGAVHRPGWSLDLERLEKAIPGVGKKISFLKAPLIEISSTDLRKRIAARQPYRYFLPKAVYLIIDERSLYLKENSGQSSTRHNTG
jgi:nicotinate-nucleotide adenylyltransferase